MSRIKYICIFVLCLILVAMTGCKSQEEKNYVVVELPEPCNIESIFHFKSVTNVSVDTESTTDVYSFGILKNGNSVVWSYDSNNTVSLIVYVQEEISEVNIAYYSSKLYEEPISYEEFKEKYEK